MKQNAALAAGKDHLGLWSLFRYGVDIAVCQKLYGATAADYFKLRFFEKTPRERKTYFTSGDALRFINRVNGEENNRRFWDRNSMYRIMGEFTKREQIFCPPEDRGAFEAFFQRHGKAFFKPTGTFNGSGIEVWSTEDTGVAELYERALGRTGTLDEPVIQHPEMARLNPGTVNTVKLYTMKIREECRFIAAELHIGRRGALVDNYGQGGLSAGVDLDTGAVLGTAYDPQMHPYAVHPDTGAAIEGFVIPHWEEILRFTETCALACPLAYVEWDMAIRAEDCVLIEANANARSSSIQRGVFQGRKRQFAELEKQYLESIS